MVTFPNMTTTEKDSRNCSTSWQPQPVLLDFGMTIKLPEAHRLGYAKLIYSVSRFDLQGLKEAFVMIGYANSQSEFHGSRDMEYFAFLLR
jgi:predicted unusual protein kinase regulating ubiquinone biosynthesis (AarF/ABC1/UbiB family)